MCRQVHRADDFGPARSHLHSSRTAITGPYVVQCMRGQYPEPDGPAHQALYAMYVSKYKTNRD